MKNHPFLTLGLILCLAALTGCASGPRTKVAVQTSDALAVQASTSDLRSILLVAHGEYYLFDSYPAFLEMSRTVPGSDLPLRLWEIVETSSAFYRPAFYRDRFDFDKRAESGGEVWLIPEADVARPESIDDRPNVYLEKNPYSNSDDFYDMRFRPLEIPANVIRIPFRYVDGELSFDPDDLPEGVKLKLVKGEK